MASPAIPTLPPPIPPPPAPSLPPARRRPLLSFLTHCKSIPQLKQIHAQALRTLHSTTSASSSTEDDLFLYGRIIHFASSSGDLAYARHLLHHHASFLSVTPNTFIWNTLIAAHARSSNFKHVALDLYSAMLADGRVLPDKFTFPVVLKACTFLFLFSEGTQIQTHIVKLGLGSDIYINNSLIHFYSSCGKLEVARRLFDGMRQRSAVTWNVIIDAYVVCGDYDTGLELFREMQVVFEPDVHTLQSVVCACGGLGALSLGIWAHAYVLKKCKEDVVCDVFINNSLLDMYCKCGSIGLARQLFERMLLRDITSWNSMIIGLAAHGLVQESLDAFSQLSETERLRPNSITFVGVLSACNHGGLVSEGRRYFSLMVSEFGIEPRIEHYGCMVDLLARAGHIEEALDLVSNMLCKPDAVIWRSLLDACWKRNAGIDVSESVARRIFELEDGVTSGAYVLLSRIYASANRWNDVGLVRRLMDEEGIRKEPGCSLIEMDDGSVHEFLAGDTSHPQSKEIYGMLQVVEDRLSSAGYTPDLSQAPMIAEERDGGKEHSLRLHSERIAIAFGLLNMRQGLPLRILKNLRMCRDCHAMTKLISNSFGVQITVRDRIRFHHFKDGSCSCGDYW